jgi:hypothetical protein
MQILLFFFLSSSLYASYSKPQLIARYGGNDSYNSIDGLNCYSSEPAMTKDGIFLGCHLDQNFSLVRWKDKFEIISSTTDFFSKPEVFQEMVAWSEFNEIGVKKVFEFYQDHLIEKKLNNLSPDFAIPHTFTSMGQGNYVYRLDGEKKQFYLWNGKREEINLNAPAHFFPPISSSSGNVVLKIRRDHSGESAPDELWRISAKKNELILQDKDSNLNSKFKSFRHSLAHEGGVIAVIGIDEFGEGLFLIEDEKIIEVVRVGREIKSLDYFSPKLRHKILVFRGEDLKGRKAFWTFENRKLNRLVTQGDVVLTDKGLARVDGPSQDAVFYGAAGIGPDGEIVLQAVLKDFDHDPTVLGISLLKFTRE